jgi:hypothetical protein
MGIHDEWRLDTHPQSIRQGWPGEAACKKQGSDQPAKPPDDILHASTSCADAIMITMRHQVNRQCREQDSGKRASPGAAYAARASALTAEQSSDGGEFHQNDFR